MTEASAIRRYIAWWNRNAHDRRFRDIMRGRRFPRRHYSKQTSAEPWWKWANSLVIAPGGTPS
jgi:hypothetical protein